MDCLSKTQDVHVKMCTSSNYWCLYVQLGLLYISSLSLKFTDTKVLAALVCSCCYSDRLEPSICAAFSSSSYTSLPLPLGPRVKAKLQNASSRAELIIRTTDRRRTEESVWHCWPETNRYAGERRRRRRKKRRRRGGWAPFFAMIKGMKITNMKCGRGEEMREGSR